MGTLQEAAGGTAERVMGGDDAVISKGLIVTRDKISAASYTYKNIQERHRGKNLGEIV